MKLHLVCFADKNMTISQNKLVESAWAHGINNAIASSPESLSEEFQVFNRDIFKHERGVGFWVWKAYCIYKTMLCDFVNDGDIIFYSDSGTTIVNNLNYVVDIMKRTEEDIFLFAGRFKHAEWCKMDVIQAINMQSLTITPTQSGNLISMNGYEEKPHVQASQMFFIVNEHTRNFVKEWLLWCQMPGFIDDSRSKAPNLPTFAEHRHDQAILTCLQIKYNIPLHWWPSNMNMDRQSWYPDGYPALWEGHRKRNDEW